MQTVALGGACLGGVGCESEAQENFFGYVSCPHQRDHLPQQALLDSGLIDRRQLARIVLQIVKTGLAIDLHPRTLPVEDRRLLGAWDPHDPQTLGERKGLRDRHV